MQNEKSAKEKQHEHEKLEKKHGKHENQQGIRATWRKWHMKKVQHEKSTPWN